MINKICEICKTYNAGDNWVFRLSDNKESIEYNGHKQCIDDLENQVKAIKDLHKLSLKETLKQIKF